MLSRGFFNCRVAPFEHHKSVVFLFCLLVYLKRGLLPRKIKNQLVARIQGRILHVSGWKICAVIRVYLEAFNVQNAYHDQHCEENNGLKQETWLELLSKIDLPCSLQVDPDLLFSIKVLFTLDARRSSFRSLSLIAICLEFSCYKNFLLNFFSSNSRQ